MSISATDVKTLRQSTGAGILDCKKALQETEGNLDAAIEFLRKKGLASASKKASREANDGLVSAEVSTDGTVGAIVEVNCETDFVARTEDFQNFVASLRQQILDNPSIDSVETLLSSPYIHDNSKTVSEQITALIAKLGENLVVRRLARFTTSGNGLLDTYIHMGGRVAVLVEASGNGADKGQLTDVIHDVALQIAAVAPTYTRVDEISSDAIEAEKEVYRAQLADDKKPDNIKERIIEGKLKKWYGQVVLLEQEFVKDSSLTIEKLLRTQSKDLQINRFARFELGAN